MFLGRGRLNFNEKCMLHKSVSKYSFNNAVLCDLDSQFRESNNTLRDAIEKIKRWQRDTHKMTYLFITRSIGIPNNVEHLVEVRASCNDHFFVTLSRSSWPKIWRYFGAWGHNVLSIHIWLMWLIYLSIDPNWPVKLIQTFLKPRVFASRDKLLIHNRLRASVNGVLRKRWWMIESIRYLYCLLM